MAHGWLLDDEPDIQALENLDDIEEEACQNGLWKMVRITSVSIFDFVKHISQLCLGDERVGQHEAEQRRMLHPRLRGAAGP